MNAADAHQLLGDLHEESARLRDPAELQFVGGDPDADAAALGALTAQRAGIPALRLQAPALAAATGRGVAEVLGQIAEYDHALEAAIDQLGSGRAPVPARRSHAAAAHEDPADGGGPGHGHLAPPSWRRGALVAVVVLAVAVAVAVLALLLYR